MPRFPLGVLAGMLVSASAMQIACAGLPALKEKPWIGYFAAFESKKFEFGITAMGKVVLVPIGDKGKPVSNILQIPIQVGIEEVLPSGKVVMKELQPDTLESADPASDDFTKTVIKGKVTGDAAFEMTIEQSRGVILIGGRLLEPGTLTNPLRFAVRVKFPSAYKNDNPTEKKEEKAFAKKIEDDQIDLKWSDGKRKKQPLNVAVEASSKELNGPGIAAAEVEISAYKGKRFVVMASGDSSMALWNEKAAPLHEGFSIHWLPDADKDKEGKARISIEVK